MSLKDMGSKATNTAKNFTSGNSMHGGFKGKIVAVLFGALMGVLVDLGLQYISQTMFSQ